ncbi:hypothetical protein PGB90_008813 [Kerria lacca]
MGSCLSCILHCCGKQDETSQYGETNDRTQLIDPNNDNVTIQGIQSENFYNKYIDPSFSKKSEEHSDLNKILQEMATNVIDVASLGSHSLEQHEYRERMSFYMNKMKALTSSKSLCKLPKVTILQDVPNPDKILVTPSLVSDDELNFIYSILNNVDHSLEEMKIENSEDLLIPFQVHK